MDLLEIDRRRERFTSDVREEALSSVKNWQVAVTFLGVERFPLTDECSSTKRFPCPFFRAPMRERASRKTPGPFIREKGAIRRRE